MPTNTESDNSGYRWCNPCAEEATRADIEECFGAAAYWKTEITRLTRIDATETDLRRKRHNRLMLLNAQTQLEAAQQS